ncbi:MAG: hypothetical protein OXU53_08590 [Deltaproteobacteria bacterium]|nr:hypothetical protein [Deltaproteobacteria bacterium]
MAMEAALWPAMVIDDLAYATDGTLRKLFAVAAGLAKLMPVPGQP